MSVQKFLDKIKNGRYGADITDAIIGGIKKCYDDASVNHDNANMEVKMARGTHNTLNDRLDKSDEIQAQTNAQLSDIKRKISHYANVESMKNDGLLQVGDYVKTNGYYSPNDGGNANYIITNVENTGKHQELLNNGLYAELMTNEYNIRMFGAKGDGIADDTESFKQAINFLKSLNKNAPSLNLNTGKYRITTSIELPLYIKLVTLGNVEINYTGTNELFHIYNEKSLQDGLAQNAYNIGNIIDGSKGCLIFKGLGIESNQTCLKFGEDIMQIMHTTHTAWFNLTNIYIERFGKGIYFTNTQNYMQRFYNVVISNCGKGIVNGTEAPSNSGELITFNSCAILNNTVGVEINNIINFNFDNCSIDYNKDGIVLNYGGYYELNLSNCWLEGNNSDYNQHFLIKSNATQSSLTTVNVNNCYIYPKSRIPSKQFVGKMFLNLNNNTLQCNRYTQGNYPQGEFICGEDVVINSFNGFNYTDNPMLVSSTLNINDNWNFSSGAVNDATVDGFEIVSAPGSSTVTLCGDRYYTSNKSLKVSNDGTYKKIKTTKFDVSKYSKIIGDSLIYLSDNNGASNGLNITTTIKFYNSNDVEISQVSYKQNFTYTIDKLNNWFSIPQGINNNNKAINVPYNAKTCDVSLEFGNIRTGFYIDNIVITGY